MHRGLSGLDRIELVMDWRRRAGKIVDFINLNIKGEADIVPHYLKKGIPDQMRNVHFAPGLEIIDAKDLVPVVQKPVADMRTQETRSARDQYAFDCQLPTPIW